MSPSTLSERDRLRALLMLAAGWGLDRWGRMIEARARYGELNETLWSIGLNAFTLLTWLPIAGAFAGALLVRATGPRTAALIAAGASAVAAAACATGLGVAGGLATAFVKGALTVGLLTFAASLATVDEKKPSWWRFHALAGFVLAPIAVSELGTAVWYFLDTFTLRLTSSANHVVATILDAGTIALIALALPRQGRQAEAPAQPPYRAPSTIEAPPEPEPLPAQPPPAWRALRALAAPAALFALGAGNAARRMSGSMVALISGAAATAGAVYFFRGWQRRNGAPPVAVYACALMLTASGWLIFALSQLIGVVALIAALNTAIGSAGASVALGYAALAARGDRAGTPVAVWMLWTTLASYVGGSFNSSSDFVFFIVVGIAGLLVGRSLMRRADEVQSRFG